MLKNLFLIALLSLTLASPTKTFSTLQDDRLDELPFDEEPLEEVSKNYFAIGGGGTLSFSFINFDDINKFIAVKDGVNKKFEGPMLMTGGVGFTGIPWVPNLRAGISGMSGISTIKYETNGVNKQADYSISSLGISFDYGIVLVKSLALLPGVGVNFGSTSIKLIENGQNLDWNNPNSFTGSQTTRLDNSYITLQPALNLEWAALDYFVVRLGGGFAYQVNAGGWALNQNDKVVNAPNGLKVATPYAQLGIMLGLFNY